MLRRIPPNSDEIEVAWSTELSPDETRAVIVAGEFIHPRVPLDEDETALVSRLRSLLG